MTITPRTRLDHYEILSLLGKGGMGEVYLARDARLNRNVALKLLPAEFTQAAERIRRFEHEAKAASALNHPNILTIYEIGAASTAAGHTHFIATEYIEGETLRERLTRERLSLQAALDIATQIASALAAAHEAGIIHRDIKPENVMLRKDGIVKVLDFGLAKLTELRNAEFGQRSALNWNEEAETLLQNDPNNPQSEIPNPHSTAPGMVMGTASYMSPEQARGEKVDARSDLFSLGVVLYEMLAGHRPFAGANMLDVVGAVLHQEPKPLADASPELQHILNRALQKDRAQRYQTSQDLLLELQSLKQEMELEARWKGRQPSNEVVPTAILQPATTAQLSDGRTTSSAQILLGEIKRHRLGVALTLVLLLAAVGSYFTFFARSNNAPIDSLAILPFANASGDPEMEYLSDGLTESLINSLAQLPDLRLIARTSVFRYKGKEPDLAEVGKALGARAVLMGRVLQRGEQLTVSAELVDLRDNKQLWGDRYERNATDLLAVQSQISSEIGEKLRSQLLVGTRAQLAKRETVNPQAYELLLKGRFYSSKHGPDNEQKATGYFQQATTLDPTYALAWAELSMAYRREVEASLLTPKEGTPKALAAAQKALELNEALAEAHAALATLKRDAWEWAGAERAFKRALELNPNLAGAHGEYAYYLVAMKRFEQAIAEIKLARELDPLSLDSNANVGDILCLARRYDESLIVLKKTLELEPNRAETHRYLGWTYMAQKMYPEAIAAFQESLRLGGNRLGSQRSLGIVYAQLGEREKAQAILTEMQNLKVVPLTHRAALYAALGERDQAFALLAQAYDAHDLHLQLLGVDFFYDSLHSDPRFSVLMRRIGLPE
jgi:serine/threonine-protein kinase